MDSRHIIRPLTTPADYAACVELQQETWGPNFGDFVPPTILKVAQRLGGVAAGAFDDDGLLLGFVFGFTGVEHGRVVHWSDMLAVRPGLRDAGLGRRLKEWQREAARRVGAEVMYWTFDPLVARNAHLNFNRLGARAHEYVREMYGEPTSLLHRGLGTDRLVVAWAITGEPATSLCPDGTPSAVASELREAPLVGSTPPEELPPAVRIVIPLDIHAVVSTDPAAAMGWRQTTRIAWEWALANDYEVAGIWREPAEGQAYYLLVRSDGSTVGA